MRSFVCDGEGIRENCNLEFQLPSDTEPFRQVQIDEVRNECRELVADENNAQDQDLCGCHLESVCC